MLYKNELLIASFFFRIVLFSIPLTTRKVHILELSYMDFFLIQALTAGWTVHVLSFEGKQRGSFAIRGGPEDIVGNIDEHKTLAMCKRPHNRPHYASGDTAAQSLLALDRRGYAILCTVFAVIIYRARYGRRLRFFFTS